MSDFFNKYMRFNLTARLTMIASVVMSWRCAEWFMNLEPEEQTTGATTFVSVIMGVMSGIYGLFIGSERGKK